MSSSAVYNYLAGKQTKGALSNSSDREKEISYAEKAAQAKKEEEIMINEVNRKLKNEYQGNRVRYPQLNFKLTYLHYKFGGGRPLYVDISGLHISSLSAKQDFNNEKGKEVGKNTFDILNLNTFGITVGYTKFRYLGNNKVEVVDCDKYDFNLGGTMIRNLATMFDCILHTLPMPLPNNYWAWGGTTYTLNFTGQATINP